jgi:tRNA pseudouridine38-40 synthase
LKNIGLIIEYRGTSFSGWQIQPGQKTVQEEIAAAILKTTAQRVEVVGAGRTDAGVHALGQVANFKIEHDLDPSRYRDALNYYLPEDIRIKNSEEVPEGFHARFSAKSRRYRYLIARNRSALYRDLRWENDVYLNSDLLKQGAEIVVGTHDFTPFCVVASQKEDNHCTIEHARWMSNGPLRIFEIRGNRFLHSMVRSLVGAMVNLAEEPRDNNMHNLTLESFRDIIEGRKADRVVFTAPAHGLYLVSVQY